MSDPVTILIIDDEAAIRMMLRVYLEDCGFRILVASDGQEGLEVFDRGKPDVVITDLRMPKMDGFGFLEYLQASETGAPVIVITGIGDSGVKNEVMRRGALACLFKPFPNMKELREVLKKACKLAGKEFPELSRSGEYDGQNRKSAGR